jgi:hypothetical protein
MKLRLGLMLVKFGYWLAGDYWKCTHCGYVKRIEEEVYCWKCGKGEMIYRGD